MEDQLYTYIAQARATGMTDQQIMTALIAAGWQESQIKNVFQPVITISYHKKHIVIISSVMIVIVCVAIAAIWMWYSVQPDQLVKYTAPIVQNQPALVERPSILSTNESVPKTIPTTTPTTTPQTIEPEVRVDDPFPEYTAAKKVFDSIQSFAKQGDRAGVESLLASNYHEAEKMGVTITPEYMSRLSSMVYQSTVKDMDVIFISVVIPIASSSSTEPYDLIFRSENGQWRYDIPASIRATQ